MERADRPLHDNAQLRHVIVVFRGNEAGRGDSLLNPLLEGEQRVVLGILDRRRRGIDLAAEPVAEGVGARAEGAMVHARHHEEAKVFLGLRELRG